MTRHRFGAVPHDAGVSFSVWAPSQPSVALVLEGGRDRPMTRGEKGFFHLDVPEAHTGARYWFRLAQGLRPDPASRFQPDGPLGPSQIVDTRAFGWRDQRWRGAPPRHRQVIYEMHIGTFTREGTWAGAMKRLPYLVELGVTTLEVMPLAEFAGSFGWGYDGVSLFAPSHLYGEPHDVQRFVDEAHRLGLAVILDVVYNHLGPVGNFFPEFSQTVKGPPGDWGDTMNYDGEGSSPVREFVKENAAYWIREFHFDGLRLDATQGIQDRSEEHIVSEICRAARDAAGGRDLFLVGESEPQDTALLTNDDDKHGLDAIWNEDWHHAAFVALTGRREAYFTDYRGTAAEFAAMAKHGPLYQGQWYTWQKQRRGGFALGLASSRFVNFLENHDQVANTGRGVRLCHHVDQARWRTFTTLLLIGPALPMIFQGQEFGSSRPFAYFADHEADLARAVERGRYMFLEQFPSLSSPEMRPMIPSPNARQTFEMAKLDDQERTTDNALFYLHRDLLQLRTADAVLRDLGTDRVSIESSSPTPSLMLVRYRGPSEERLLVVNIADDYLSPMNDPLLALPAGTRWTHLWSSEHPQYGGRGVVTFAQDGPWYISGGTATLLGSVPS